MDETNYSNDLKIIMEELSKSENDKFLDQNQEIFDFLSEHNQNRTVDSQFDKRFFANTYKPISNASAG